MRYKRGARTWALGLALLLALSSTGCVCCEMTFPQVPRGAGRVVEEERDVGGFTGLELGTWGTLEMTLGDEEALRIEGGENVLSNIETEVEDGMLHIRTRPGFFEGWPNQPLRYYLTVTKLDTIILSGSGDIRAPGLQADTFSTTVSGSGNMEMESLDTGTWDARISGSGDIRLGALQAERVALTISGSGGVEIVKGEAASQNILISGSGSYRAENVASSEAEVRISGSGSATLRVADRLVADIGGSGNVRYVGDPAVEERGGGSGNVERIGE